MWGPDYDLPSAGYSSRPSDKKEEPQHVPQEPKPAYRPIKLATLELYLTETGQIEGKVIPDELGSLELLVTIKRATQEK